MPIRPENRALYPADWEALSYQIRFVRARRRCEFQTYDGKRCTAVHGKPHPHTGAIVVLTTAHLDHDPTNSDPANLRAGCQCCHNRYDRAHRQETAAATRLRQMNCLPLFGHTA